MAESCFVYWYVFSISFCGVVEEDFDVGNWQNSRKNETEIVKLWESVGRKKKVFICNRFIEGFWDSKETYTYSKILRLVNRTNG